MRRRRPQVTTSTPESNQRNNRTTISVPVSTTVGSFAGRVWEDTNRNGRQDKGEPGIAGATVRIFAEDANPAYPGHSQEFTSDAEGRYTFHNVPSFTHTVTVDPPSRDLTLTKYNAGFNDKIDSDFDPADIFQGTARSKVHKLKANGHVVVDAGYVRGS